MNALAQMPIRRATQSDVPRIARAWQTLVEGTLDGARDEGGPVEGRNDGAEHRLGAHCATATSA